MQSPISKIMSEIHKVLYSVEYNDFATRYLRLGLARCGSSLIISVCDVKHPREIMLSGAWASETQLDGLPSRNYKTKLLLECAGIHHNNIFM